MEQLLHVVVYLSFICAVQYTEFTMKAMPPWSMDLATTLKLNPHPEPFFVVRLIDLQRDSLEIRWRRDILDALPDILKLPQST